MKVQIMKKLNLPKSRSQKLRSWKGIDSEDEKELKSERESDKKYESSAYQPSEESAVF